jgi:outer membrane protein OmpA-like peptidoglycan-associated protein
VDKPEIAMSFRFIIPLAASAIVLSACEMPRQSSSGVSFGLNHGVTIPAGVPCSRIKEDFRDQVAGCELFLKNPSQQQMTREELIDLNVKFRSEVTNFINFDFDKSVLRADARAILDRQAAWIVQYPDLHFSVFGHTDLVGSLDYNFNLAKRRADVTVAYLISKGVSKDRLESVVSFGETQPLIQTVRREEANRRAVTEVSGYLNRKRVSRVPVGCDLLIGSYAASYPQCIDSINVPPIVPPTPEPTPPTVVEAEYGYDTEAGAETSDSRGRASISDDGEGNRVTEAYGETGPEDNPRTVTHARSETSTTNPDSVGASASTANTSVGLNAGFNADGTVDIGSVEFND